MFIRMNMKPFTRSASPEPNDLEAPLLEQPPKQDDGGDDDDRDAVSVHEVHMICFAAVNHPDDDYQAALKQQGDLQPSKWCANDGTFLRDLAVSLVLPALLTAQFYLAYRFPETATDTGLSLKEALTILGLYVLACLSYRFSCNSDDDNDNSEESVLLYLLPELVSDAIALLLMLHSASLALTATSFFAIVFSVAAVWNTCSFNVHVRVAGAEEDEEEESLDDKQDGLDVTYHDRTKLFLQPMTV